MLYRLVCPMKRKDSSRLQFNKRIPADIKERLVGERLRIPVGEEVVEVTVTPVMQSIRFSLRSSNTSEVKQRRAHLRMVGKMPQAGKVLLYLRNF